MSEQEQQNQEATQEAPGTVDPTDFDVGAEEEGLWESQVSDEAVKDVERRSTLPSLTYTTVQGETTLKRTKKVDEKTGMTRRFGRLWSHVVATDPKTGEEVQGFVGYRVSPDFQNKFDFNTGEDTGKPDRATINFMQARKALIVASGEDISPTDEEVLQYLVEYSHRLRIVPFNGEPFVVNIQPVVEK